MRTRRWTGDAEIEHPAPPLLEGRVGDLVRERPEEVTGALAELLSERRKERIEEVLAARTRSVVVVLDHVSDPHNAAAVIRTAEGLGLLEVHAIEPTGELPLSRRVTQGCHKWLEVAVHRRAAPVVESLRERGYTLLAATERSAASPTDYGDRERVALCMGNEHDGLSDEVAAACEGEVGFPMSGFTRSLNVSVATALLLAGLLEGRPRGLDEAARSTLRARYYVLGVRGAKALLDRRGIR